MAKKKDTVTDLTDLTDIDETSYIKKFSELFQNISNDSQKSDSEIILNTYYCKVRLKQTEKEITNVFNKYFNYDENTNDTTSKMRQQTVTKNQCVSINKEACFRFHVPFDFCKQISYGE